MATHNELAMAEHYVRGLCREISGRYRCFCGLSFRSAPNPEVLTWDDWIGFLANHWLEKGGFEVHMAAVALGVD